MLMYKELSGSWSHNIVVNVHAINEGKSEELNDDFYEKLEQAFHYFPKYETFTRIPNYCTREFPPG